MDRVIIESPFAGDVDRNVAYAQAALLDSLSRGEAPIASHLLHTQVLDDTIPEQRQAGIDAGVEWIPVADLVAFYTDLGWSGGMRRALDIATVWAKRTEFRKVGSWIEGMPVKQINGLRDAAK